MIALKKGLATKSQIAMGLQEQKRETIKGNPLHLGDALVRLNIITESQKEQILETQKILQEKLSAKTKEAKPDTPSVDEPEEVSAPEEEEALPDLEDAKKVQNGSGFELAVTVDRFQAYIYPLEESAADIGIDAIRQLIEMENINFGVIEDEKITAYLASSPSKTKPFKIAQGIPVDPGTPTEIKYHFDTSPIKPGTIDEKGNIDYKDRGKIPWVKAETLIAEIIPGTSGKSGTDVYGKAVDPPPPDIVTLKYGRNVRKGEEGVKAYAEIDGRPVLLDDGTFEVSDTLQIPGDVGVETGNIEFEGHIDVKGGVQEGYKVKAKSLNALEIHNAEVETVGDIVIVKGIIGGRIRTDGTVKARHIRDTTIDALGDVQIEKEVYESRIESNGVFRIERGTIMGSTISAMKGVEANEIGSNSSDPCTVITGIDNRLENQVTKMNMKIAAKEKEVGKLRSAIKEHLDKPKWLEEQINDLAQKQDQAMRKGVSLKETLKSLQKAKDYKNIKKVMTITKALNAKLKQYQERIDALVSEQEEIEKKVDKYNDEVKKLEQEIIELQDDIKSIVEMSKIRQSSSGIKVTGTVYDRTSIRGRNAALIVKGNLQRVHFQEIKNPDENSDQAWLMSASNI